MLNSDETEKLRKEMKIIREENRKLRHIISYGNISTLETLVDKYMDYSRLNLKKIAVEIQLTEYEKAGTDKVAELIEHLEYAKEESHKLISVSEEGAVVHNISLKHDVEMAREIVPHLESIIHLKIEEEKSIELEKVLTDFLKQIKKCFR